MQLGDVLDSVSLDVATSSIEVTHVDIDSRRCVPGTLFFAMPGVHAHGATFVDDAARHGALAAVSSQPLGAVIPVSYTHLDVYKRQPLRWSHCEIGT